MNIAKPTQFWLRAATTTTTGRETESRTVDYGNFHVAIPKTESNSKTSMFAVTTNTKLAKQWQDMYPIDPRQC